MNRLDCLLSSCQMESGSVFFFPGFPPNGGATSSLDAYGRDECCPYRRFRLLQRHDARIMLSTISRVSHYGVSLFKSLGNVVASLTFGIPVSCISKRSRPMANPPSGGMPYLKASR